jgi:Zn-dependent protease
MLFSILGGGDIRTIIISLILSLPVLILALVCHEVAHGYVAYKCGDPTAYNLGRLTLNPIHHLDPIGFLCMMIFGYGWAKPVPINTRLFRNPKRGMAICAAAGPAANLLLGLISAVLFGASYSLYFFFFIRGGNEFLINCLMWSSTLFQLSAVYNFIFMTFNLIPIPPFDGSRIFLHFLPTKIYFGIMRYERQIMFGLLIALLVLDRFNFSPFSYVAEWLTFQIASPVSELMLKLLEPLL